MSSPVSEKQMKPGRKPVNTEPKNKRTAQNRAAQRAFRERKERKMKELEDKVAILESEKLQIANESELLRLQVGTLMRELSKYKTFDNNVSSSNSVASSDESIPTCNSMSENNDKTSNSSSSTPLYGSISSHTPNSINNVNSDLKNNTYQFPNTNRLSDLTDINLINDNFKGDFDERVFCDHLNEVCGSKECPIPKDTFNLDKKKSTSSTAQIPAASTSTGSETTPNTVLATPYSMNSSNDSPFELLIKESRDPNNDEMSFLYENNSTAPMSLVYNNINPETFIDGNFNNNINLGLDANDEFLDDLFKNGTSNGNSAISPSSDFLAIPPELVEEQVVIKKEDDEEGENDEDETVPPTDEQLLKCSQIWERITSHPRFSDIDIDGLCDELKQKAKCSEKGAVVDCTDVGDLLKNAFTAHQQAKEDKLRVKTEPNSFLKGLW